MAGIAATEHTKRRPRNANEQLGLARFNLKSSLKYRRL